MITEFEEACLALIDSSVATASDDELFAGGYLRGHISLATAVCEEEGVTAVAILAERVTASLDAARSELSPADQAIVHSTWSNIKSSIKVA